MSTDPSPQAVSAGFRAPGPPEAGGAEARRRVSSGGAIAVADGCATRLDETAWCRWWRDLIVERYRIDRFDAFVPLPFADCPWELRVALGRVVEQSMADLSGRPITTQLVIEALGVAGFGRVRDLVPDARRVALVRAGWSNDPWPGDDDLRLGVLGSVADALLHEVPPTSSVAVDLRTDPSGTDVASPVSATVLAATRSAVFAYARHVEDLARRSRDVARSYQF
jgi:hypothetical protein